MKILKIIGITVAIIIGVLVMGFIAILIIGPSDPIILSESEQQAYDEKQAKAFASTNLSGFKTTTISGETVTSDIFSDYDITMVNIWYTGCSPCIEEMPDIAKLYDNKTKNYNVITVCTDLVDDKGNTDKKNVKFASKVMNDAGAKLYTLIPDKVLQKQISSITTSFPTTIFVDRNGKIVGEPHFGGRSAADYEKAITERLNLLKTQTKE